MELSQEFHGVVTDILRTYLSNIMGMNHGNKSWTYLVNIVDVSCEYDGHITISRKYHGNIMEISWEYHGNITEISRKSYGSESCEFQVGYIPTSQRPPVCFSFETESGSENGNVM